MTKELSIRCDASTVQGTSEAYVDDDDFISLCHVGFDSM